MCHVVEYVHSCRVMFPSSRVQNMSVGFIRENKIVKMCSKCKPPPALSQLLRNVFESLTCETQLCPFSLRHLEVEPSTRLGHKMKL